MRKRGRIALVAVILAVAAGSAWWCLTPRQPGPPDLVYDGHPLSYWVKGPGVFAKVTKVPTSLDSNAVPYLVEALNTSDGVLREAYIRLWPHLPGWLQDRFGFPNYGSAPRVKLNCCAFLSVLGSKARPSIPALLRLLREDDNEVIRLQAARSLAYICNRDDKEVIEALGRAERDKDRVIAEFATQALQRLDPDGSARAGVTNASAKPSER